MAYTIETIHKNDVYANRSMDELLLREGISRDKCLEYSCGIFDDGRLIATGSYFGNTLRCLAVSSEHRSEGLINQLISHLVQLLFEKGRTHLFIYTKNENVKFFKGLGFFVIAETEGGISLLENRPCGFSRYCSSLGQVSPGTHAAIIMNANPFTLGHRHLVEQAATENDTVHIFVLSEDRSAFPADLRFRLVKEGLADIKNLVFHETGPYLISAATFPSYFYKDEAHVVSSQAGLDAALFIRIAKQLGISRRYLGEEIPGSVTEIYNSVLCALLPAHNISCSIVPRLCADGKPISASTVRQAIKNGKMQDIKSMLPETTWNFLLSDRGKPVIEKIMEQ